MSTAEAPLLGIDWGTTNRRAYLLDREGQLLRTHADDQGILAVKDFPRSLADLLQTMEAKPAEVLMSGMVGSRNGWHEVPYLTTQRRLDELGAALFTLPSDLPGIRCRIAPGMQSEDGEGMPDVMRGEETQVYGALMMGAPEGWFVHPGTHCKWVHVREGRVTHLLTFMTGELYALLSAHGTLGALMQNPQEDAPAAFQAGLQAASSAGLTHRLFSCRAMVVTDRMPAAHTGSWLSGLLIGKELQEITRRAAIQGEVQIVGSASLAARYEQALRQAGLQTRCWPADDVYVAAIRGLAERASRAGN